MVTNNEIYYPTAGQSYDEALEKMMIVSKDHLNLDGVIVQLMLGINGTDYRIVAGGDSDPLRQQVENWLNNRGLRRIN